MVTNNKWREIMLKKLIATRSENTINLEPLLMKIKEVDDNAVKHAEGKDLVLLIGTTDSGKSTFGNYLLGHEMEETPIEGSLNDCITTAESPTFPMGHNGKDSMTSIPKVEIQEDIAVCDCPGFDDSRGPEFDIANAYAIRSMAQQAKSIKHIFVLVDCSSLLADRGAVFLKTMKMVSTLFGGKEIDHTDSISLVVSKTLNSDHPITLKDLKINLKNRERELSFLPNISMYAPLSESENMSPEEKSNLEGLGYSNLSTFKTKVAGSTGIRNEKGSFGLTLSNESEKYLADYAKTIETNALFFMKESQFNKVEELVLNLSKLAILNDEAVLDCHEKVKSTIAKAISGLAEKDDSLDKLKTMRSDMPSFAEAISSAIETITTRIENHEKLVQDELEKIREEEDAVSKKEAARIEQEKAEKERAENERKAAVEKSRLAKIKQAREKEARQQEEAARHSAELRRQREAARKAEEKAKQAMEAEQQRARARERAQGRGLGKIANKFLGL